MAFVHILPHVLRNRSIAFPCFFVSFALPAFIILSYSLVYMTRVRGLGRFENLLKSHPQAKSATMGIPSAFTSPLAAAHHNVVAIQEHRLFQIQKID